jgi:hypothetical protein
MACKKEILPALAQQKAEVVFVDKLQYALVKRIPFCSLV